MPKPTSLYLGVDVPLVPISSGKPFQVSGSTRGVDGASHFRRKWEEHWYEREAHSKAQEWRRPALRQMVGVSLFCSLGLVCNQDHCLE